jgi:hypothetical protein
MATGYIDYRQRALMDRCVQLAITPYSAKYNTIDYPHLLYPLLHRSPNRASNPLIH